jgi:hypothetical protein
VNRPMDKCWAACLGDCEGGMSGEHIVSQSLFKSEYVDVSGFHWCKGEVKRVGLASLTKNALCRKHNSSLSQLDSVAAHAFDVLRNQTKLSNDRAKNPNQKYKTVVYSLNASALEKWLLKTLINVEYGGDHFIGPNSTREGYPSDDLVNVVFGKTKLPKENGLYVASKVGLSLKFSDTVQIATLLKDDKYIQGGRFTFRGVYMFLDLVPGGLKVPFEAIPSMSEDWHYITLSKPFRQFKAMLGNRVSHVVNFNWI